MPYIANIFTNGKFEDEKYYNITFNKDTIIKEIPTLIIGWENVKELYPNASILNWQIDDNTYWTYGKRVRRDRYETDIVKFKKVVYDKILKKVEYQFFNVLIATSKEKEELFGYILSDIPKTILLSGNMIYIYSTNKSIGLSLSDIEYEGADKTKTIALLYKNPHNSVINEKDYISYEMRELFKNRKYIIPYLAIIKN